MNRAAFVSIALAGFGLCQTTSAVQDIDAKSLSEDKISIIDLSRPGVAGKTYLAATLMAAPMQKVCATIQNYPAYPKFMPNTDKAELVKTASGDTQVDMTLKLPLGKIKKYRLQMEPRLSAQSCKLAWKMLPRPELTPEETIADTTGYWLLTPWEADPAKTVVKYHVYSDPGPVPVGLGWIVDAMGKDSLPKALEALRGQVQKR
ncbi:hypothetical protein [Uliginosibacterium gangwonense]|uniref:hypothetical protein n=1 Tax=Uliginosibacterium gangwonense TaxID=392736 RepID=UPI0003704E40|nr:hypothetical protein [Uliginosibacterium gangwonense]